ncbi:MAG: SDR family oxidoreductase [Verrucomicrobia bacterium]|nr:SDR family oxidoreductase [Verrucomicrobiota bacterium]
MNKLDGKIALITGGSTGLGFATADRFLDEGAEVVITGRRQAELDSAVKRLGRNVLGVQGDVSNLADLDRLYATIQKEKGHLDIVFANAGGGSFAPLGSITEEHFDQIFNINVKGLVFTAQKALPLLKDGGAIILNGSIAGSMGMAAFSVYSATKAAVRSFARTWTSDLKERKIRVNVISPGPVPTEGYRSLGDEEALEKFVAQMAEQVPLGRVGRPDEIAKAVVFLASDDSSFVAGAELVADGGMIAV